jgi:hypothetical protein
VKNKKLVVCLNHFYLISHYIANSSLSRAADFRDQIRDESIFFFFIDACDCSEAQAWLCTSAYAA